MSTQTQQQTQQQAQSNGQAAARPPVKRFKVGSVEAAIWVRDGQYPGSPMFSVNIIRSYRSAQDGQWYNTHVLTPHALLEAVQAAQMASIWIAQARVKFAAEHAKRQTEEANTEAAPPQQAINQAPPQQAQPQQQSGPSAEAYFYGTGDDNIPF